MIKVKRVYEPVDASDGRRFLVDRLWPRGISKQAARIETWLKEAGPSNDLRKWFGHDPARWTEFKRRYRGELQSKREVIAPLLEAARGGDVTLVYSARDEEHNQAVALKEFLDDLLKTENNAGMR